MTDDQLEAALCAWEWVISNEKPDTEVFDFHEIVQQVQDLREKIGTVELRIRIGALGPAIHEAWEMGEGCYLITPFDWEFVPVFMLRCIDWRDCSLNPSWRVNVKKLWDDAREDEAEKDEAHRRDLAGELRSLARRVAYLDKGLGEDFKDFIPRIEGVE